MKKINFNVNRRMLYMVLGILLVSVFSLTIVYAALSVTLNIVGNAEVVASSWDIHLKNPKVKNGSVNTDVPTISGNTLTFNTTLSMPGDYYEFTVDVVNNGTIDAMIDSVVKNPELTSEQAKYLKYEITYQNGESIASKQLLAKNTTMPIKVRIEYRKDLVASDLPTGQVVLDLSLTLEYVQSDGSGSSVTNNGVYNPVSANGDINEIGTIVTIGTEQFYTIGTEGNNVKLLSMYNLYVGNSVDAEWDATPLESPTGKQDSTAIGSNWDSVNETEIFPFIGTTEFSSYTQKGTNYSDYNGSIVEGYVNNYKAIIESEYGVEIEEARLISFDELTDSETFDCVRYDYCSDKYPWIYSTSYWSGSAYDTDYVWRVNSYGYFDSSTYFEDFAYGIRPVIIISKSLF